jgi:hypothetical protein
LKLGVKTDDTFGFPEDEPLSKKVTFLTGAVTVDVVVVVECPF